MTPAELTALLVLATVGSFTPGPNTTLSTALAANLGLRPTLRFVLAVPFGWGLLLSLCAGGLGTLVVAVPALRWAIQAFGVAYLLWLAWKLLPRIPFDRLRAYLAAAWHKAADLRKPGLPPQLNPDSSAGD